MRHPWTAILFAIWTLTVLSTVAIAQANPFTAIIRETEPLTPEQELATMTVPDGFRVQLFASEPDIQKPMNLAFDARGRLWVSGSNDYPFPSENPPHGGDSIRILEDTDHDGRADKVTVFVDDITIPIGLLPYKDGVIAFSIPNIWFFRDTDGDDRCDIREKLLGPFDYSRDTHGLNNAFRRGYDGWIYACHGFNNHSEVTGADGHTVKLHSGNTYRFRPDGSRIEHFTHGQVNPFGMTVDPMGDWYSSDCHTKPITLLMQDGYYPSFGRPHDGLGFVPSVMDHQHGSTAIAGIAQYTGSQFPAEYYESLFVGNVMASRVHRDTLQHIESSVDVIEEPDFLTSTDPWFRPVDIQCGPDGALYIADFYNRIIGHYEVPLDHPGRDRLRARIWRIEYVGDDRKSTIPSDLTRLSAKELIDEMETTDVGTRMRCLDELTDRLGSEAVTELSDAWYRKLSPSQRIGVLWARHRLGQLPDEHLIQAALGDHPDVRIHAMRVIGERSDNSIEVLDTAITGLTDRVPLVQRAAACGLATTTEIRVAAALLKRLINGTKKDRHLKHALRIALRNQLREGEILSELRKHSISNSERRILFDICLAVPSSESAAFLLESIPDLEVPVPDLRRACELIAKHVSVNQVKQLESLVRDQFVDDTILQFEILTAISEGLRRTEGADHLILREWAIELATGFLQRSDTPNSWMNLPDAPSGENPWGLEQRKTADGQQIPFLSSLPGGERAVSRMKSTPFVLPDKLSLYLCGHLGFPQKEAMEENFVRVCLVEGDREIERHFPPRNDVAQQVSFDLTGFAGEPGYIEIVDGIELTAYAWIAISRIEPPVIRIPDESPQDRSRRLQNGCHLVGHYSIDSLLPQVADVLRDPTVDGDIRLIAARTLSAFRDSPAIRGLAVFATQSHSPELTTSVNRLLNEILDTTPPQQSEQLFELMKFASLALQRRLTQELSIDRTGAELAAEMIQSGRVSGRVLQDAQIQQQFLASLAPETKARLEGTISRLPPVSEERDQLINELRQATRTQQWSLDAGEELFKSKCAACHQLAGEGKVIGPQLDGIGARGVQRLLEDIIDPNRNVDVAFRSRTYALTDGRILTGILRNETDEAITIADNKGETHTISKVEIEEQKASSISIMPDNWGTTLKHEQLCQLVSFLATQTQQIQSESAN